MKSVIFQLMLCALVVVSTARQHSMRNYYEINSVDNEILPGDLVDDDPKQTELAKIARHIVHKSNWASLGTKSTLSNITGYPMVNVISVADSLKEAPSTGRIYFLVTELDISTHDLMAENKATVMFNNDVDLECSKKGMDPMDPPCGRVIITGYVARIKNGTEEFDFGYNAYVSRHPSVLDWQKRHHFFLCRFHINQIIVLAHYGGITYLDPDNYYNYVDDEIAATQQSERSIEQMMDDIEITVKNKAKKLRNFRFSFN